MVYAKCTPFEPLFSGVLSPEDLILYWKSCNFIICYPKTPFFVSKHPKFSYTCHQKTPFSLKLHHFCHQKTILFLINIVTERSLLWFTCTSLYTNRVPPGYLHPLSPSQRLSLPLRSCLIIFSVTLRPKKKKCYIGVTRPTLKLGPTLIFFF